MCWGGYHAGVCNQAHSNRLHHNHPAKYVGTSFSCLPEKGMPGEEIVGDHFRATVAAVAAPLSKLLPNGPGVLGVSHAGLPS